MAIVSEPEFIVNIWSSFLYYHIIVFMYIQFARSTSTKSMQFSCGFYMTVHNQQ